MAVVVGSIVGPYRLIAQLGSGGMGVVFVGEHMVLGQTAIKVLHTELTQHAQISQRFINEAIVELVGTRLSRVPPAAPHSSEVSFSSSARVLCRATRSRRSHSRARSVARSFT